VFYEAPHRILEALEEIAAVLGPRPVVVARELTKLHEEFLRGTAAEIREALAARDTVK
jgi:16S rRNA (cytidine1402-2'-O)-methyltransferase